MGAGPNVMNNEFKLHVCTDLISLIKSLHLQTAMSKVVSIEGIVTFFIRMGDLCVPAWFGIVENVRIRTAQNFLYQLMYTQHIPN